MIEDSLQTIFLSRLFLNPCSRQAMNEIAHPYEMHRTLLRAFPHVAHNGAVKPSHEFGLLFRTEVYYGNGPIRVYAQSRIKPDWTSLEKSSDYLESRSRAVGYECKDIMPALSKIQTGQVFSFRLRANPTKRIGKKDDSMKGKRAELWRESEQIEWLIRKGQTAEEGRSGGFELGMKEFVGDDGKTRLVYNVKICPEGKQTGRKRDGGSNHAITHASVLFEGVLRVTDKDAFLETIIRGIGSGKAFGFGLLSIAPINMAGF